MSQLPALFEITIPAASWERRVSRRVRTDEVSFYVVVLGSCVAVADAIAIISRNKISCSRSVSADQVVVGRSKNENTIARVGHSAGTR